MASKGRGTTDEIRNKEDTLGLVKWYDNKPVYMCSNIIASGEVEKVCAIAAAQVKPAQRRT